MYDVTPEDFGLRRAPLEAIRGGDAKENAEIIHKVLGGSLAQGQHGREQGPDHGPHRDIVLANASAALVAAGRAKDFRDGVRPSAAESIDSGAAFRERLTEALIAFSIRPRKRSPKHRRHEATRPIPRQPLPIRGRGINAAASKTCHG